MYTRKWTVLFYANGNNDLEPENWKSVLGLQRAGQTDNVNVLIQIGRADRQLVKIIRPLLHRLPEEEWSGVRRYSYTGTNLVLLENLEFLNMADSRTLYDFIRWGMENYPSEHYMLILGGHAYQLVGMMPDYSQDRPYIMGFPEMCLALEKITPEAGKKIDLLILDTCYCNCVEVLYELGKGDSPPVDNVLTYVGKGPLGGIPFSLVIELLNHLESPNNIDLLIKKLVDTLDYNLVALKIDHAKFESIKKLCNDIAFVYLSDIQGIRMSPGELITCTDPSYPWNNDITELRTLILSMILYAKKKPVNQSAYVNIQLPDLQAQSQLERYYRLSFARNNQWTNLLSHKPSNYHFNLDINIKPAPLPLPYEAVYTYISMMNAYLCKEQWQSILHSLKEYKGWI